MFDCKSFLFCIALYFFKIIENTANTYQHDPPQCSTEYFTNLSNRFDCFPKAISVEETCLARGCCWKPLTPNSKEPWCFYPQNYKSYQIENITHVDSHGLSLTYRNVFKSPYPNDILRMKVDVFYETESRVRVKIYDSDSIRYESPYPKTVKDNQVVSDTKYHLDFGNVQNSNFGFAVTRKSSKTILFDTRNVGGFTFSDQFLQISAQIASKYVYGLGEVRKPFLQNFNWTSFGFFTRNEPPIPYGNSYGSHPFYLAIESDGKAHGVFLHNSNAMDVTLQPSPAITYRTVGGILDFYFFLGENPSDVVEEYLQFIGKPNLPPYWALGFQLSRWSIENVSEAEAMVDRNLKVGIPLDVFYGDIDYMDNNKDFSYDKINYNTLPQFVNKLHTLGIKYVIILDPGIDTDSKNYSAYEEAVKHDLFIKNENGSLFKGKVWNPGQTAFIDFTHPKAYEYWSTQMKEFYKSIPYDGIWIDMNDPSNMQESVCPFTKWDNPPYMPNLDDPKGLGLKYKTICMSTKQHLGTHYDLHNLYGIFQAEITSKALIDQFQKRPFVLSRSTFAGSGLYSNHWTGYVFSDWESLKQSVPDLLSFNLFGIPMVGADICGFLFNTTPELCARWSQVGAFYPFSRNHNAIKSVEHDPAAPNMGSMVTNATKSSLILRYRLLPYLYTLFHYANLEGKTVARPLFFEFPQDKNTYEIEEQFLWGSALMIVPVLKQNVTSVEAYLPNGTWYLYPSFQKKFVSPPEGSRVVLDSPITEAPPLLLRGGYSIVTQTPDVNTAKSRYNDFQIIVVLDSEGRSRGSLFWDDGETLDTEAYNLIELITEDNCVIGNVARYSYDVLMPIENIQVVGIRRKIQNVTLGVLGYNKTLSFTQDEKSEILTINTKLDTLSLSMVSNICWS